MVDRRSGAWSAAGADWQPGAGKSAVLARAALNAEAEQGGPGLAFQARAATIGDFLTALADLTGIDTPALADELVTSLADLPGQSPFPVVLDALDEAASDRDRRHVYTTDAPDAANQEVLRFLAGLSGPVGGSGTGMCPATSAVDT